MSKVTNIFHVAGNYIAEQHIDIHDNNHCSIYATSAPEEERTPEEAALPLPREGKYDELIRWLAEQKTHGRDYYAEADFNRSLMCRNLLKIIGWEPNQDSLRKAQNK